jgi:Protein of unknown function (DUF3164)
MNTEINVPGHRRDHLGRLVPEAQIKPIDQIRDEMVLRIAARAAEISALLAQVKREFFEEIDAFVELSAAEYGAKLGGGKGNITLHSYDASVKVIRAMSEHIRFDERLQAAKKLVDECLNDWTSESRSELRTIVQDAFRVDQSENLRVQQILSLRRYAIDDERWQRAMAAISDSIQVIGSKPYVRVYKRIGTTSQYQQIPLDMAGVPL